MVEDQGIASHYRYHKLRILHQFVAMRDFKDELLEEGVDVNYFEFEKSLSVSFYERIEKALVKYKTKNLQTPRIPDTAFRNILQAWATQKKVTLEFIDSPQFMVSDLEFADYLHPSKKPFMKTFYESVRKREKILVNKDLSPVGGKWSFDLENRKKMPKSVQVPNSAIIATSPHFTAVRKLVEEHFKNHPGELPKRDLWIPTNRAGALTFLKKFFETKLDQFGPFEDAIDPRDDLLFHSGLSTLINLGLLTPSEVVKKAISFADKKSVKLESLEGFIRQIAGWREFVNGIHQNFHATQSTRNFFAHESTLKKCWYDGTTGLPPVDDAIKKVLRLGYNHHIERLMILSNAMLLCETKPTEVHKWFMEMYLDSYEWVMGPNVYGMGQFSDGGIFATKPYLSGSNYILKMSSYGKGDWCEIWDGLYWSFIHNHKTFFSKNPRLSMMSKMLEKMDGSKKERLFAAADRFKEQTMNRPKG